AFLSEVQGAGPSPAGVDPNSPAARSSLSCKNETRLIDARLASIRVTCSTYYAGAAHPTDQILTFNLDLEGGRMLALGDLFRPGAPYLDVLSRGAISQLDARFQDDSDARQGAAPVADNFA